MSKLIRFGVSIDEGLLKQFDELIELKKYTNRSEALRDLIRDHLVEQAGGRATTGNQRLMEVKPESLHQRVALILGSRNEVERIERYHAEYESGADRPFSSPLFNERSLFRPETRL